MNKLISSALVALSLQSCAPSGEQKVSAEKIPAPPNDKSAEIIGGLREQLLESRLEACIVGNLMVASSHQLFIEDVDRIEKSLPQKRKICKFRSVVESNVKMTEDLCKSYHTFVRELGLTPRPSATDPVLSETKSTIVKTQKYCPKNR